MNFLLRPYAAPALVCTLCTLSASPRLSDVPRVDGHTLAMGVVSDR